MTPEQDEENLGSRRKQAAVLDTYLTKMRELLLQERLPEEDEGVKARRGAQAETLEVLQLLDRAHKGTVIRFLAESEHILIFYPAYANLHGAYLTQANLRGANLSGVQGITLVQLAKARSLHGATMPNGSVHA